MFPRRENKPKKGLINDATAEQLKSAAAANQVTGLTLPLVRKAHAVEFAKITEADKKTEVFKTLRKIRTDTRYRGRREKKAAEKEKAKE